jgi:DNA-binding transcriptional ArsR family regulator
MIKRDVFQAIADPKRRAILALLAQHERTLNGIAENFTISRPAISRHIKILIECGLVEIRKQGREHICEVRAEKLDDVAGWIEQYRRMWDQRFVRLDEYLAGVQKKEELDGQ